MEKSKLIYDKNPINELEGDISDKEEENIRIALKEKKKECKK